MDHTYAIPMEMVRIEEEIERSRFIASLAPARTIEQARHFIKQIRAEYPDASHHVPAYLIGGGNQITDYYSDDGEPSGTAGMPILMVLRGSGLGDTVIVVTRYFGGVLLGKGGLVKAYTSAARIAVNMTQRGYPRKVTNIHFIAGYDQYMALKNAILKFGGIDIVEDFGVDVIVSCSVLSGKLNSLLMYCDDLFSGKLIYELREEREAVFSYPTA